MKKLNTLDLLREIKNLKLNIRNIFASYLKDESIYKGGKGTHSDNHISWINFIKDNFDMYVDFITNRYLNNFYTDDIANLLDDDDRLMKIINILKNIKSDDIYNYLIKYFKKDVEYSGIYPLITFNNDIQMDCEGYSEYSYWADDVITINGKTYIIYERC